MAIVGDVGGRRRLDYTVYGPVVNKAARFQEANKALKSTICIGPTAASALKSAVALRSLGRIDVRGMEGFAEVFEPWEDERSARHPEELRRGGRNSRSASRTGHDEILTDLAVEAARRSGRQNVARQARPLTLRSRWPSPPRCAERPT